MALLSVRDLTVGFPSGKNSHQIVLDHVSFYLAQGEILGLVGESGSGKSMAAHAVTKLLSPKAKILAGEIRFDGIDILHVSERYMRTHLRGSQISIIFQNTAGSFNPVTSIGAQFEEMFGLHRKDVRDKDRDRLGVELLGSVGISDAKERYGQIAGLLSGGMAQRAGIALMSLVTKPRLLIADEPTTALDVTVQAQVLDLLVRIVREHNMALLFITHDFGLIAEYADRVAVIKEGRIVETQDVHRIFSSPRSEYMRDVLHSLVRMGESLRSGKEEKTDEGNIVAEVEDLHVHFPVYRRAGLFGTKTVGAIRAVDGVSFSVEKGQILGIVGESGCGKTTLARAMLGLVDHDEGHVRFWGKERHALSCAEQNVLRQRVQGVAQNPYQSLTPTMRVGDLIGEGLDIHRVYASYPARQRQEAKSDRIRELMRLVELPLECLDDFAGRLSGGEQQRVAIARALATNPEILILDEPTSSLDASRKKTILNLLLRLRDTLGLTYIIITHELPIVSAVCDSVAVMYLGCVVETGSRQQVFENPTHPYTRLLLSAVPIPDPVLARARKRPGLIGGVPSASNIPSGCRFRTRCPFQDERCESATPLLLGDKEPGHLFACHYAGNLKDITPVLS